MVSVGGIILLTIVAALLTWLHGRAPRVRLF
jgi:hypothetical protein